MNGIFTGFHRPRMEGFSWTNGILCALILAACLSASDFAVFARNSEDLDIPKASPPESVGACKVTEQHFVTVDSLRVHYIESGAGRAVVMIHGNAGGVEDFEFGEVELLSREYRVVAIDRAGHGKSDRPRGKAATLEYQASLLHQTLAHLGITQPVLVGHSWGGALALAYALKYPAEVSAMVLLAPAAYADDSGNGFLSVVIRTPLVGELSLLLGKLMLGRRMLKRALAKAFYPQVVPDRYLKLASSWLSQRQLRSYLEDELALNDSLQKMSKRYSEINIPVVIVTGDEDKIVSPKENAYRLQAALPQSRLMELKDVGHEIPQTHPESIYAALELIAPSSVSMRVESASYQSLAKSMTTECASAR
jgi:pimeloyl-ACP methyl ester carboxylesterase